MLLFQTLAVAEKLYGCRRKILGTMLGTSLCRFPREAEAKEKLETMEGLKGRDYGKERQRC